MSRYHSTISRREFMKVLGLGGAGLATAAAIPPVFHDLDEMAASPAALMTRPSWVREVAKPTIEIDWPRMQRSNYFEVMWAGGFTKAWGKDSADLIIKGSSSNQALWRANNKPGYTLPDTALNSCTAQVPISFMGPQTSPTPESLGMPRWEGTPEENARMVRAFMRLHGAYHVGFVELDTDTTEKMINSYDGAKVMSVQGPRLDIKDVDLPEDKPEDPKTGGGGYRVIPKKARWVIVYTLRMSPELIHRPPSLIAAREHGYMYDLRTMVQGQTQQFLRTLGYNCMGDTLPYAAFGQCVGFAVMAGLGETCRAMHTITPEYGLMQRVFIVVTDLPLAPGKPVDFGVYNFCKTCKKCADYCPAHAIPPSTEPSWEVKGPYNRPGVKHWYRDEAKCRAYIYTAGACAVCFAVCPYSKTHQSSYTSLWQSTVAKTPVLNRAIRKMDDFMGYGVRTGGDIEKF
nr:putative reductive dehalogenase [uncultured bacterium]